ncbi:putative cytosolic protein [Roseomonas mucosa]|uniref:Purine nucleoside phosphorylase n=1 Tax=Roseomonas mucosa TaxID=207340 RepID=A0A1S8D267_9PROT|nr:MULTISPECIES: peptidoglycan editing factor PgeF [Roseomonas]MBS5903037.1 peptidoglycan editing factor PgeF [Acetobacteraceae bacterium]MCG7352066.1 peptidoglycan editing factor PgeF [Roseomonas mucosa]MCG7357875.1 peptidoglycan editing factor PgeF [Roseomonas mucosa]MDT8290168.1 peptidoglycan editing factor PgeF [Roseomonas mucosa]MDT8294763.1 peptidoglycan editing factor PgeF [Roseomonas mucosa]
MSTAEFLVAAGLAGLPHGFFTRRGGVSEGTFASLNCSLSGADDPTRVAENRALAMEALGLPPAALVGLHQVHGPDVVVAREPWPDTARPRADGIVTDRPGLALGIVTADCGPVLFADAEAGVIGACHAGWRGAVAGICEAVLEAMEGIGAQRGRVVAALGPCIRQASYEVGRDLFEAVGQPEFFQPGARDGHWQFDMAGYIAARLQRAGTGLVQVIDADTQADAGRFFSHRRRTLAGGGPIGHQLSTIALRG